MRKVLQNLSQLDGDVLEMLTYISFLKNQKIRFF